MADDIDVTPGSGKTVRFEEISSKQHQYVISGWGAAGAYNKPDIASGKPFPIQLRSHTGLIPIGEPTDDKSAATDTTSVTLISLLKQLSASIQELASKISWSFDFTVVPTVTNGAYSAGDIVGGLITFDDIARANNELVLITSVEIACKAAVTPSWTLILFSADPSSTTKTDNAAYSLNAADAFKVIAAIPVTTIYDHGTPNTWQATGLDIVAKPDSGTRDLYGLLIDNVGVTLTSTSDIQIRLQGLAA